MTMLNIISLLATIMGSAMALSNGFQAIKIFQRKSAADVAVLTYIVITLGAIVWIVYGVSIGSLPLIISNTIGFVITVIILIGCFMYNQK